MFRMKGQFLTNEKGKVMDVHGNSDTENRDIIVWKKHGGINQQWDIIYKDQWKRDPIKGELNKDFGLYVLRDFYIVSQMNSRRYLDIISNNFVIKTRNGRNTQTWYFHQQSLTIRSKSNNYSWNIKSSGKTNDMQVSGTNSKWW
jgi:hypothetical protein